MHVGIRKKTKLRRSQRGRHDRARMHVGIRKKTKLKGKGVMVTTCFQGQGRERG